MGNHNRLRLALAFVFVLLCQAFIPGQAMAGQGSVTRLSGHDRYDTMSSIVGTAFRSSEWAVVACGGSFPDALSASAIAGSKDCPLILTPKDSLGAQARHQLSALGVRNAYIMGGTATISAQVEGEIRAMGIATERVGGENRVSTSVEALRRVSGKSRTVIVATGNTFADSLAIGPWSYRSCSPIVLADAAGRLSDEAVAAIRAGGFRDYLIVGGANAVSDKVREQLAGLDLRTRLAGANRYVTAAAIASWERASGGMGSSDLVVATGQGFSDALAGVALAGRRGAVMALVSDADTTALQSAVHGSAGLSGVFVLGGAGAVSPLVYNAFARAFGQSPETGFAQQASGLHYYGESGRMLTAGLVEGHLIAYDGICHPVDRSKTGDANADALRVARLVAACAGPRDGRTDFERVAHAAVSVKCFCNSDTYTMEGPVYYSAYGVFIAREYSCAGSTRALGLVLDCMGYPWTHAYPNQMHHQWNILTLDGREGYADGMGGFVGYGTYPGELVGPGEYFTIERQPDFSRELDLGLASGASY